MSQPGATRKAQEALGWFVAGNTIKMDGKPPRKPAKSLLSGCEYIPGKRGRPPVFDDCKPDPPASRASVDPVLRLWAAVVIQAAIDLKYEEDNAIVWLDALVFACDDVSSFIFQSLGFDFGPEMMLQTGKEVWFAKGQAKSRWLGPSVRSGH